MIGKQGEGKRVRGGEEGEGKRTREIEEEEVNIENKTAKKTQSDCSEGQTNNAKSVDIGERRK